MKNDEGKLKMDDEAEKEEDTSNSAAWLAIAD
jgi:hypothetical protein